MSTRNYPKTIANPYVASPSLALRPEGLATPGLAIEAHAEYRSLAAGYGPT